MKTTCEEEGYSKARSGEHPFLSSLPSPSPSQSRHTQIFHASSTDVGTACSTGLQQDWVLRGRCGSAGSRDRAGSSAAVWLTSLCGYTGFNRL